MPRSPKQPKKPGRKVIYPKFETRVHVGKEALSVANAKELIGWEEETEEKTFEGNHTPEIYSFLKRKVRLLNNITNRPIRKTKLSMLKQEILRRKWHFNGEPVIVGKTGLILNGQHTLISLVLAAEEWATFTDWREFWTIEPVIDRLVVFGIDESDDVVNTMDTCVSRSLADVIYRSLYFASMRETQRKKVSRICDHAIRMLWHRTGAKLDAFSPLRTHSESLDFLDRHERLLECVKYIWGEGVKKVKPFLTPGFSAAMLYLMGCSGTDPRAYQEEHDEKHLDWSNWDKACDFWTKLCGGDNDLKAISKMIAKLVNTGCDLSDDRMAVLVKAWHCYVDDKPITAKLLQLKYTEREDLRPLLTECPTAGGIDIGDPSDVDETVVQAIDPSPEEIRERASVERQKAEEAKLDKRTKPRRKKEDTNSGNSTSFLGKLVWVVEVDEEPRQGKLIQYIGVGEKAEAKIRIATGHQGAGTEVIVPVNRVRLDQPV